MFSDYKSKYIPHLNEVGLVRGLKVEENISYIEDMLEWYSGYSRK